MAWNKNTFLCWNFLVNFVHDLFGGAVGVYCDDLRAWIFVEPCVVQIIEQLDVGDVNVAFFVSITLFESGHCCFGVSSQVNDEVGVDGQVFGEQ